MRHPTAQAESMGMSIRVARTGMAPDCPNVWVYPSPCRPSSTVQERFARGTDEATTTDPTTARPVEHAHHPTVAGVNKVSNPCLGYSADCGVRHTLDGRLQNLKLKTAPYTRNACREGPDVPPVKRVGTSRSRHRSRAPRENCTAHAPSSWQYPQPRIREVETNREATLPPLPSRPPEWVRGSYILQGRSVHVLYHTCKPHTEEATTDETPLQETMPTYNACKQGTPCTHPPPNPDKNTWERNM